MRFDASLDAILDKTSIGKRTCSECSSLFNFEQPDLDLCRKLRVPPPLLCPSCKRQRRLAFLNYTSLYKRKCDVPGHVEDIISAIPPLSPVKAFDYSYWNSYAWEPFSYGEEYVGGSFKKQFLDFLARVPHAALTRHAGSVDSDYTLYGFNFKNCYFTFGGAKSENVHYSNWPMQCKDSLDLLIASDVELSSNSVFLSDSYRCNFCYFSAACINSDFLYLCKNVQNSFGCVNLENKQYCFFNEQLTKEEYEARRKEVDLGDREVLKVWTEKFWEFVKSQPTSALAIKNSENCSGNFIKNCKDCVGVFRALDSENVRYADFAINMRDSMHTSVSANGEELYETASVAAHSSRVKFSYQTRTCIDSEFLVNCRNVSNCFACVGLENKQFCILNVQYTEEEYYKKVDEIKTAMLEAGEYGEFFSLSASPYAYNGSLAQIAFPLTQKEAESRGLVWQPDAVQDTGTLEVLDVKNVPVHIKDVTDDILSKAIRGESGKVFRLIRSELEFYRSQNLAIPTEHPYEGMIERFGYLNNLRISEVTCASCGVKTLSRHPAEKGFTIYCEDCYKRDYK